MQWREQLVPTPMRRVAIVAPDTHLRRVLVEVADAGVFEADMNGDGDRDGDHDPVVALAERLRADSDTDVAPRLSEQAIDVDELESVDDPGLVLGEAALRRRIHAASHLHRCAVLPGWTTERAVDPLQDRLAPHGGAVAPIPLRRGQTTPTAHDASAVGDAFRPLVDTYGTVPSRDLDPTLFAAIAYMVMFGMMFGDVAHGLAIVVLGVVAAFERSERWRTLHTVAAFLIGAGGAAMAFGLLYGDAFGPTGLVPTLWIRPLDDPETLLVAGLVLGACLLAATFVIAIVDRWRESGLRGALYDASGVAGAVLFAGAATFVAGAATGVGWLQVIAAAIAGVGALLTFVGLVVKAGPGGAGVAEAGVEMFDTVLRMGSNVVSFTRLAAFGLTHAVITEVVWDGTVALWNRETVLAFVAAVALFTAGNIAAFALGALVAAIQALRLEYYEMFSRLFTDQGRPFRPWHVPTNRLESPCTPG
jgi:V/A-type H+-transporting ATPase subunit I